MGFPLASAEESFSSDFKPNFSNEHILHPILDHPTIAVTIKIAFHFSTVLSPQYSPQDSALALKMTQQPGLAGLD